ncbi:MAG: 1-deoxy-D-xylulose-5-phosphate reductoisomerase [Deltaproteobacteria bacterium]|nr:1-deoxy-D-xylulose-5-phosphate reductoisomerase [Deltaproteobacteria bacterium]
MKKKLTILGSTGSVGTATLDICRQHPDRFEVVALVAGRNTDLLAEQIKEFKPRFVAVAGENERTALKNQNLNIADIAIGTEGAVEAARLSENDLVVSAIVGAAGLEPTLAALQAGHDVALANKESMVIAGHLMSDAAKEKGVSILPVDSEHSAIFQCLNGEHIDDVDRLVLTASGGPFFFKPQDEFANITKAMALKHPNWDMGAKITIDSASMMNKGLEVMEAFWLFGLPLERLAVVVHPQSIIHSMVEFNDGSVMAQLGEPDMRVPIAYALSYPRRIKTDVARLSLPDRKDLTFFEPDLKKFPCLQLAFDAAKAGGLFPAVLNAANEEAVAAFLNDEISFVQIPQMISYCFDAFAGSSENDLQAILQADQWARSQARGFLSA